MKSNISLALNGLLILAVIYLFTQLSTSKGESQAADTTVEASSVPEIVYINADSLLGNYKSFRAKLEDLKVQEEQASISINKQMGALESEYKAVQRKIQQGLLSPSQIAGEEQRLGKKQQKLLAEQDQLSQQLMMETQRLNAELQDRLVVLMDSLRAEKGYKYILQYGQGGSVLSAAANYDITNDVLNILNEEPESEEPVSNQDSSSVE
jgi:outer membrane protein